MWQTFVELVGRPGATAPTLFRFRHADGSWRWLEAIGYKEALYRIAQEALHNVVKHARAREAEVTLELDQAEVVMTVRDHGQGFEAGGSFPGHLGLRSMQERAEVLGGTFTVESAPHDGTLVRVRLPLRSPGA